MRMRIVLSRYALFFCAKVCIITYVHVCVICGCVSARGVNHVNRKHVVCALMRNRLLGQQTTCVEEMASNANFKGEYDFVEKPSEEFFCPVTYEVLLDANVGGYKMCFNIDANGWDTGKGTHVSVTVYMMKGEFDSHLKWPFKGEITVELVNQKEGGKNYEMKPVQHTECEQRDRIFQRVTKGERAEKGWGLPQLISHADLYKPEKGKEYLLNDTLIFRVTKVEVTSV